MRRPVQGEGQDVVVPNVATRMESLDEDEDEQGLCLVLTFFAFNCGQLIKVR